MLSSVIYDFDENTSPKDWKIVNDVVMGGRSTASFEVNADGNAVFSGEVSLQNNGGFASVRHNNRWDQVSDYQAVELRIKGDGKNYQFRIKKSRSDYYSYIKTFETSGEWETVRIPLNDFYPSFRGRTLDMPNYRADQIEEVAFLIANKKEESFSLEIDRIELVR